MATHNSTGTGLQAPGATALLVALIGLPMIEILIFRIAESSSVSTPLAPWMSGTGAALVFAGLVVDRNRQHSDSA